MVLTNAGFRSGKKHPATELKLIQMSCSPIYLHPPELSIGIDISAKCFYLGSKFLDEIKIVRNISKFSPEFESKRK